MTESHLHGMVPIMIWCVHLRQSPVRYSNAGYNGMTYFSPDFLQNFTIIKYIKLMKFCQWISCKFKESLQISDYVTFLWIFKKDSEKRYYLCYNENTNKITEV
jgi:hypothetical protein